MSAPLPCIVVPVHFCPYPETGEFACFGVLLHCRQTGYCGYIIGKERNVAKRIHGFFRELPKEVYRFAREAAERDIEAAFERMRSPDFASLTTDVLRNLIRPRENVIRYGSPIAVMSDDPVAELTRQYERIVGRGFATPDHVREIECRVREYLRAGGIRYRQHTVSGPHGYGFHIPFAIGQEGSLRVIKPIDLSGKNPTETMDECHQWRYRIGILLESGFTGDRVLMPIRLPDRGSASYEAANECRDEIGGIIRTLDVADGSDMREGILSFAG